MFRHCAAACTTCCRCNMPRAPRWKTFPSTYLHPRDEIGRYRCGILTLSVGRFRSGLRWEAAHSSRHLRRNPSLESAFFFENARALVALAPVAPPPGTSLRGHFLSLMFRHCAAACTTCCRCNMPRAPRWKTFPSTYLHPRDEIGRYRCGIPTLSVGRFRSGLRWEAAHSSRHLRRHPSLESAFFFENSWQRPVGTSKKSQRFWGCAIPTNWNLHHLLLKHSIEPLKFSNHEKFQWFDRHGMAVSQRNNQGFVRLQPT